ncbi:MAG: PAS domain S-box protein, partial [Sphaerochaeta sp.]|nr:PAS domain S-box protein [Sphaerochaeta sp.]
MSHALDSTWKALVENLPDGVCYVSMEGIVLHANRSFASLLGFSSQQVLFGLSLLTFMHPDYHVPMEDFLHRILQKDKSLSAIQVQILGSDENQRWMEIRWIDIPVEEGAFLVVRDLTSYKTLQEELLLQALTDELTGLYNRRGFRMMAEQ